jgi:Flp pilus assembly protein TadG
MRPLLNSLRHTPKTQTANGRRGVATVELAACLPVLLMLVVGAIEGANFIFLKQSVTVAAYESANLAAQAGGTSQEARRRAKEILKARTIEDAAIDITPSLVEEAERGQIVAVTVSAPSSANSIGLRWFFKDRAVAATVNMLKD